MFQYFVADSMNQMGFSKADPTVNEQRVIGGAGMFANLHGGRPG